MQILSIRHLKIPNFVNRVRKNHEFRCLSVKIVSNFSNEAQKKKEKKRQILSIGHGKIANFVDQSQKNHMFSWLDVKNLRFHWSGQRKNLIFSWLIKLYILFVGCKKLACSVCIPLKKNMNFVDRAQKNQKYCQSDMEKPQASSISLQKILNFVYRSPKNLKFCQSHFKVKS